MKRPTRAFSLIHDVSYSTVNDLSTVVLIYISIGLNWIQNPVEPYFTTKGVAADAQSRKNDRHPALSTVVKILDRYYKSCAYFFKTFFVNRLQTYGHAAHLHSIIIYRLFLETSLRVVYSISTVPGSWSCVFSFSRTLY